MSLYRVNRRYSNGTIKLTTGQVVDLDDATAELIERDSAGVVQELSDVEVDQISTGLAQLSAQLGVPIRADWHPDAAEPHVATGGGPVMTAATMFGGLAR